MRITARDVFTTQVLTVTLPYPRSSSTYTTVLRLEKGTPTPQSQQKSHAGLSGSSIGAIVGSVLGALVLLLLIYFCCFRSSDSEDTLDDPSSDDFEAPRTHSSRPHRTRPPPSKLPRLPDSVEKKGEEFRWTRQPRRRHQLPMNEPRPKYSRSRGPGGSHQTHIIYPEGYE
ncbi:hypothetical protein ACLMJK_002772 [Lecanora helva]